MNARSCGIFAKINRAGYHLEQFDLEIIDFLKSHPYTIRHEYDLPANDIVFRIAIGTPSRPHWGALVSEILHLLRSALDNLVCAMSPNARCEKTEFPVFLERGRYDKEGLPRIEGVAPKVRALIDEVQPHAPGGGGVTSALWVLHELNRLDKHRAVHLTATAHGQPPTLTFTVREGGFIADNTGFPPGPFHDGAEIARFHCVGCLPQEVQVEGNITPTVGFDKGSPPAEGAPVLQTLAACYETVALIANSCDTLGWPPDSHIPT